MSEWILAYDAGCANCASVAERIEQISGGRLTARNLRDPQVTEWRQEALGNEAPWEPTLIHVEQKRVRAWVGRRMMVRAGLLLGPRKTSAVADLIQGVTTAPNEGRRRLLKMLPGAAAATFFLQGGAAWAGGDEAPALDVRHIGNDVRGRLMRGAKRHPDFRAVQGYLSDNGYKLAGWDAKEARDEQAVWLRSVVAASFAHPDGDVVELAYGEGSDGSTWAYAVGGHGEERYALVNEASGVRRIERSEAAETQITCVSVCLIICNIGCSCCSCGLICIIACAANPFCAIICGGICAAVCGYGVCNTSACRAACGG